MPREIKCDVLKVFSEYKNGRGDIIRLQIISWNNGTPKLEKRTYYYGDDEEEHCGKLTGMTHDDVQTILKEADTIDDIFGGYKPKKGKG